MQTQSPVYPPLPSIVPGTPESSHFRLLAATPPHRPWTPPRPSSISNSPAQMARRLRAISHLFVDTQQSGDPQALPAPSHHRSSSAQIRNSLIAENVVVSEQVLPEIAPIVNLRLAQRLHLYQEGTLEVWSLRDQRWNLTEAQVLGVELILTSPFLNDIQYINFADADISVRPEQQDGRPQFDIVSGTLSVTRFRVADISSLNEWVAAFTLAQFERLSLAQAYTASVLLVKARDLADVHVLLQKKRHFVHAEWCDVRLPQVTQKWLRLYIAISPSDKKNMGSISMYSLEKMSKKTLVVLIDAVDAAYNVFPEHISMIDLNAMMRVQGQVNFTDAFNLLANDSPSEAPSRKLSFRRKLPLTLLLGSIFSNHRTPSGSEALSPITRLALPFLRSRGENPSEYAGCANHCYILPQTHPGVAPVQTMIRSLMPIIDAFKLYGRPNHLISDKTDPRCMLFGLPSLPCYQYMSSEEAIDFVNLNLSRAVMFDWDKNDWNRAYKQLLEALRTRGNKRGHGNVGDLFGSFDDEAVDTNLSSPPINFPSPLPDSSALDFVLASDHNEIFDLSDVSINRT